MGYDRHMDLQTFINILFGMALVWHHWVIFDLVSYVQEVEDIILETLGDLRDASERQKADQAGQHTPGGMGEQ